MRGVLVLLLGLALACEESPAPPPTPPPANKPTTAPATQPADEPVVELPASFFEYVQANDDAYAEVDERTRATDVLDAGIVLIDEAVHLCGRGDLWIHHPDADESNADIDVDAQTHFVQYPVSYVHWVPTPEGFRPQPVYQRDDAEHWQAQALPDGLDWSTAFSRNEELFVGTPTGAARLTVADDTLDQRIADLPGTGPTQFLLDHRGVLAWKAGGNNVARYVDDAWVNLDSFPANLRQLIPMRDGTVTVLHDDEEGNLATASVLLEPVPVDEPAILALVVQLSDRARTVRDAAYVELQTFGPAAWPVLEEQIERQPPEARRRLRSLLGERFEPLLADMRPMPGPAATLDTIGFGGCVLHLPNGVALPRRIAEANSNAYVIPVWIAVQPGFRITRLAPAMVQRFNPDNPDHRLQAWGDEWVGVFSSEGPMRWYGNHWKPLLPDEHTRHSDFLGIDRRGRWLFRDPDAGSTLILDPRLPDTEPELPVWNVPLQGGTVGWTDADWPVMKSGGAWALQEFGWVALHPDDPENVVRVGAAEAPALPEGVIGTGADGRTYTGGIDTLVIDGVELPLPDKALGILENPRVFEIADDPDRLLLWNAPGRLVRLKRTGDTLAVVAVFTQGIPNTRTLDRIWLDPAGRLCIAWDRNQLLIAFPTGEVPPEMASKMPARRGR